jgi:peroxiredoxin
MISPIRRQAILFLYIALTLSGIQANAQASLLQIAIDKIDGYKQFSYQSIHIEKELFAGDTTVEEQRAVFEKTLNVYLFSIETAAYTDIYDGQNLLHIIPKDSTYEIKEIQTFNTQSTLSGTLKWIASRLEKKSAGIKQTVDTTIHAVDSRHLIATVYDTVIDNQRNFTVVDVFIDKASGMPDCIIVNSRNTTYGAGISTYYSESRYFNYTFDQHNVAIAVPKGFHALNSQPLSASGPPALLAAGSLAPNWTLYTSEGKKMSLGQMKGKVILLDFYFIGCFPCMQTLKPLNKIYAKYKNQQVVIASLTERDSPKAVLAFEKNYQIDYRGYVGAADVVKSYHVSGFPTFYFIDKEGKIADVFVGDSTNFEEKVTSILDNLIQYNRSSK